MATNILQCPKVTSHLRTDKGKQWVFTGPANAIKASVGHNIVDAETGGGWVVARPGCHNKDELNYFMLEWFERYPALTVFSSYDVLERRMLEVGTKVGCSIKQVNAIIQSWRAASVLQPVQMSVAV